MVNGNPIVTAEEYRQRARKAEETVARLRAERDQIDAALEAWQGRHTEVMYAAERAGVAELAAQGVRRSLLSAAQKSAIIRSRGVQFYNQLPW